MNNYERPTIDPKAIFYHGTDAHFEYFDHSFKGSNTGYDNTVHGFFFADKIENAQLFGNTIITANLDIKNPLDLRLHSIFNDQSQASTIWKILSGETLTGRKALQTINDEIGLGEIHEMYDYLHNEDANDIMIAEGYDGILSSLGNEQIEYVVFSATQVTVLSIDRGLARGRFR
ncbi:hypothetical protein FFJ24_021620 [Pedobacter sp. KBS0701]|uniref:ADP-ribosyltransferase-containing protein n=1 Tax=Pedobacter sp. KBS0701 TaxID=2578106 RepID=UPI00110E44B7|nr:hypothetical protein [Pedobacter sp. KBS0701]QDW27285.1 hypothetical protein FFJ24_021620 [Pedobacter sp. KBS0701]